MATKRIAPELFLDVFTCPHCEAITGQGWRTVDSQSPMSMMNQQPGRPAWHLATCISESCRGQSMWREDVMVWPLVSSAPAPHDAMPADALELYEEARAVLPHSRRAAAALIRGSLERLLRAQLGGSERLDEMIASLSTQVSRALWQILTAVRVLANTSLHRDDEAPELLELYLEGDLAEVVDPYFTAINLLVEELIAAPAAAAELYATLPSGKRAEAERKADRAAAKDS
ncbi:DUF4145 domain-containing protein [Agrococcus sp. SCSIO52902]|uniref:DUF4145 domain-containing protein n=1 Tax=Agrococcus sp. SCSIO52902 TaxID=2933290 RepID=UPI001FF21495|nr:DUF4145 domain-containing protein [Agrococcus sp. SCSIO52902]UOW00832.1 DUF4145 domain-containing protein [Agrococcus sp. SCSIO52902]UOW00904.1 DUF4145 domain-containing protein [Agrococcus sp. SCSIO52902]